MSQLQKNALWMGVLAVLAGGVGLYAWYGVKAPSERDEQKKEAAAKLLSFGDEADPAQDGGARGVELTTVTLTARGETTTLEKRDGAWRIVAPVNAAVEATAVDAISSQLVTAKFKNTIEENPTAEDLKRYGLDAPRFTVIATARNMADGSTKELSLKGGAENSFDGSVYVQRDGSKTVYSVQGGVRYALEKSTFELRDKEVLAVPDKDVTRIEVTGAKPFVAVKDGDAWRMEKPSAYAADAQAVSAFMTALKNFRATSFATDSADERRKDGLDKPVVSAVFTKKGGDAIRFDVAKQVQGAATKVYVLRTDGHETVLAEVPEGVLGALSKDPAELRDRSVLTFKKEDVAKLVFVKGATKLVAERVKKDGALTEDWTLLEPKQGAAQKWKLSSILWTLGSLKAKELGEENPKTWVKWGLDQPEREVHLYDRDGKVLASLALGKKVDGEEKVQFARGSRNQVVQLETQRLNDLPNAPEDLLETATAEKK